VKIDYLIVGAGLTGAVIARDLRDSGASVWVVDRRYHLGGNIHDHVHPSGIRIHTYGPHYFRTNDDELWKYVNRFAAFYRYEPALVSLVDGAFENWPIAGSYIKKTVGKDWKVSFTGTPNNFEEAALSMMPSLVYHKFVKGYTEKQWGVSATALEAGLAKRFDVRDDDEPRLMRHRYQGIPIEGYTKFAETILSRVPVTLGFDYLQNKEIFSFNKKIIFTGPIDEFFGFDAGRLKYRGQRRTHEYHSEQNQLQPCGQVNNPDPLNGAHIRTLEWKQMMVPDYADRIQGTVLTQETPFTPDDPSDYEYPFPDRANAALYEVYRKRANAIGGLLICGRLGEYRYFDMDQAIARARLWARRILEDGMQEQLA